MAITSDHDVNSIVDGFQTVAPATAVTDGVVTEGVPGVNPSQHVVGFRGETPLRIGEDTKEGKLLNLIGPGKQQVGTYARIRATSSVASGPVVVG